nr:MAG TPA: hypothetical protein [Caudoviricetes sp.]
MDQTLAILLLVTGAIYLVAFIALIFCALSGERRSPAARAVLIATLLPVIGYPLAAWYASKHPRNGI